MKNRIYILIAVIVVIIVVLALFSGKSNKISIGAVIPQTGFGAYWGTSVLKGIAMAKEDLEKLYGAGNVTIKIEDSQSSASASVSAATKLLNVDKMDVIYTEFSGPGNAVSPVTKEKNKALVYSAFNEKILEDNPYSVKTFISHEVACERLADMLDPSKKVLIIGTFPDAGPYCLKALRKVLPLENIKDIEGFTSTDFRTLLLQNKSFDPDYIIPLMYEDGAFALFKQRGELGIKATIFCYKMDCQTEKNLASLPAAYTKGSLYFEVPIKRSFQDKVNAKYSGVTAGDMQGIANAYQTVMLAGVGLAGCTDKTAACVVQRINEITEPDYFAYENGKVVDRMLRSDIVMGEVK